MAGWGLLSDGGNQASKVTDNVNNKMIISLSASKGGARGAEYVLMQIRLRI